MRHTKENILFLHQVMIEMVQKLIEDKHTYALINEELELKKMMIEQADEKIRMCNECIKMLEKMKNEEK